MLFDLPSLSDIEIINIEMPAPVTWINLTLALNDYPASPPPKWAREKNNAVALRLQCLDVASFLSKRRAGSEIVSCQIHELSDAATKYELHIHGDGIEITFQCNWIRIDRITPYLRDKSNVSQ